MKIESYLKQIRQKHHLTQEELAEKLNISRQSIIALEQGKCLPSVLLATRIAFLFQLPIEFIFRVADEEFECLQNHILGEFQKEDEKSMGSDLTLWSPWREMMSLRDTVDGMFDDTVLRGSAERIYPAINVHQTDKEVVVEADVPGVKEEEIEADVHSDAVVIRGERKSETETKQKDFYHRETSYGAFSRAVALPAEVKAQAAKAELKDGILKITVPKIEAKKLKVIKVKPSKK